MPLLSRNKGIGCYWIAASLDMLLGWGRACSGDVGLQQELHFDLKSPDTAAALLERPPQALVTDRPLGHVFPLLLHKKEGKEWNKVGGDTWGCAWRKAMLLTLWGATVGRPGGSVPSPCSWVVQQGHQGNWKITILFAFASLWLFCITWKIFGFLLLSFFIKKMLEVSCLFFRLGVSQSTWISIVRDFFSLNWKPGMILNKRIFSSSYLYGIHTK